MNDKFGKELKVGDTVITYVDHHVKIANISSFINDGGMYVKISPSQVLYRRSESVILKK